MLVFKNCGNIEILALDHLQIIDGPAHNHYKHPF